MASIEEVKVVLEKRIQEWIAAGNRLMQGEFRILDDEDRQCACAVGTLVDFDGDGAVYEYDRGVEIAENALGINWDQIASLIDGFDDTNGPHRANRANEWRELGVYLREKYLKPQLDKELETP